VYAEEKKQDDRVKRTAFVTDACTGCGGAPVCLVFCRYGALELMPDDENYPFGKMVVNRRLCRGCGLCIAGGNNGVRLTGCPWGAIRMTRNFVDKGGV